MKTKIYKNFSEFLKRTDKDSNGVDQNFANVNPKYESMNESNKSCWNCNSCSDCSFCSYCSYCSSCSDCSDCSDKKGDLVIPKIKNIHTEILKAVKKTNALDMKNWHTCDTTHCRSGWAITLAGKEGKELENKTSSLFAGMVIFNKSSDIKVPLHRFFDSNEEAMKDIQRCAKLEKAESK